MAVRHATPDAGGRGADPGGAQCAREPRDACPGGRDRAGGLGAGGGMAPRCRRCVESGRGRAARAGALGRAAGAARGGRHGRLAAGHARSGGARSARCAARRVEHRERAAAAARNDGCLGIPRALGAPPRRVLLRPTPAGAVCVGAPLEPDRADQGLRRARELRSRGTRPPRLDAPRPDAARVDGANAWQRFWRVTFPLLRPVTLFVLVTGIIGAFQVLALVMVLTGGGPLGATDVIVYRIYRTAWELLQFGDASAMALLLFAVLFGVTWVQLKLLDRRVEHA